MKACFVAVSFNPELLLAFIKKKAGALRRVAKWSIFSEKLQLDFRWRWIWNESNLVMGIHQWVEPNAEHWYFGAYIYSKLTERS